MDDDLRELARRAQASPGDAAAAAALGRALTRAGQGSEAAAWAQRALPALPMGQRLPVARACGVPLSVLPWGDAAAIVAAGPTGAVPVAELPFPATSRPTLQADLVLGFTREGERRLLHLLDAGEAGVASRAGAPHELPAAFSPSAAAAVGPAVYVAGRSESRDADRPGEVGWFRDAHDPRGGWRPLPIPEEARRWGKSIDGLFVRGDRLIALDDIVLPKVIIVLDVSEPLTPRLVGSARLGAHYTYEHVVCGALGERWLAVLSRGAGRGGPAAFVALHDADELAERCVLAWRGDWPPLDTTERWDGGWHDVLVTGERLAIAAGLEGVLTVDLARAAEPHRTWAPAPGDERAFSLAPRLEPEVLRSAGPRLTPGERVLRLGAAGSDAVVAAIGRVHHVSAAPEPRVSIERLEVVPLGGP